jgi:membrane glycosyltransferase
MTNAPFEDSRTLPWPQQLGSIDLRRETKPREVSALERKSVAANRRSMQFLALIAICLAGWGLSLVLWRVVGPWLAGWVS